MVSLLLRLFLRMSFVNAQPCTLCPCSKRLQNSLTNRCRGSADICVRGNHTDKRERTEAGLQLDCGYVQRCSGRECGVDLLAGMFWLSIRRRMVKRDPPRQKQPSAAAVPAVKEGRDKADISGILESQVHSYTFNVW